MKFMLIMNGPRDGYTQYMNWPRKILEANFASMESFTKGEGGYPDQCPLERNLSVIQ